MPLSSTINLVGGMSMPVLCIHVLVTRTSFRYVRYREASSPFTIFVLPLLPLVSSPILLSPRHRASQPKPIGNIPHPTPFRTPLPPPPSPSSSSPWTPLPNTLLHILIRMRTNRAIRGRRVITRHSRPFLFILTICTVFLVWDVAW